MDREMGMPLPGWRETGKKPEHRRRVSELSE